MTYIRTVEENEATGALARAYRQSRRAQGRIFETEKLLSLWPEVLAKWRSSATKRSSLPPPA